MLETHNHYRCGLLVVLLLASTLACNASFNTQPGQTNFPTQAPAEPVSPTATPGDRVICPQATEGTVAYTNAEAGFCFLYPDELNASPMGSSAGDTISLYGPPYPPDSMEPAAVGLTVAYAGPAVYVSTSAEYASRWADIFLAEFAEKPQQEAILVNGQQAVVMRDLMGQLGGRIVFVVAGGYRYKISVSPGVGVVSELDILTQKTWDTVTQSIVFFAPTLVKEVVRSEDVCQQATTDTQAMVNLADGFCFLAPADASIDPMFPTSGFEIGPTDTHPDFSEVRVGLVVGTFGPASGKTSPRDAVPGPLSSGVDQQAIEDITIDGKPAITYLDVDPPWTHRLAVVIANDIVYTVNMNPYDQQQYPAMIPDADRLWNMAIGSLVFFTPFE
jgi:hypothetical protein